MENLRIELAKLKVNPIINILENRCIWMEENNIKQWKSNSYTLSFNNEYFFFITFPTINTIILGTINSTALSIIKE